MGEDNIIQKYFVTNEDLKTNNLIKIRSKGADQTM